MSSPDASWGKDGCPVLSVGRFFDIVGFLMKGHVGDGAWSGDFKAPDTSYLSRAA